MPSTEPRSAWSMASSTWRIRRCTPCPTALHDSNEPIFGRIPESPRDFTALGDQLARAVQARGMI